MLHCSSHIYAVSLGGADLQLLAYESSVASAAAQSGDDRLIQDSRAKQIS